jgi:hypothetical protein
MRHSQRKKIWRNSSKLVKKVIFNDYILLIKYLIFNVNNFVAVVYTIEFQKRGLPHAHILIFLKDRNLCHDPSIIDRFISAEIPDKELDPADDAAVENYMIHGSCGELNRNSVCMEGNKCTKHFSKSFNPETTVDEEGFPVYRRRDDGKVIKKG